MNLLNLIENTTGGYDNLRALLQAVNTRSPADLNIAGDPITLDYMEANFLNGIYKAYLKAGRQEEFIQDLADPRRFDMHMKKLRDLIAKQRSFRGSVPGQRGVSGDVPAGVMEGLEALEEIAMQDPDNRTEQNSGKLNWTRMIQDYMANKPFTEFEFGSADRPLTIYRTQIYAILKAFGNMKPQQKVNIILNTFGNKIATVEYLDKLRAKKLIPQKVPAYVAPNVEPTPPGQMALPGMDMPKIKEATAQKKSPRELARDSAVSTKVQRAFQLARARQPGAASDIEAFVKDEIERGEAMAQEIEQLQADNQAQGQQIAQLTQTVAQQARAEPTPTPPAPSAPAKAAPAEPKEPPAAKTEPRAEPRAEPKAEPERQPVPSAEPRAEPAKKPRQRKPKAKPVPVELPSADDIPTIGRPVPGRQIPDQRPTAQVFQFPGAKTAKTPVPDEVTAASMGLDLGDFDKIAVGQRESVHVKISGNPLFEGRDGVIKQRISDDFFMVDVDGFGSHAFHVSRLVFEMQTKIDRFNIDRPMLPSGVAKVKYARDNNMYDDARIQEALPDKAMAVLKSLQQPSATQPEPVIDLNVPAGLRRGRPSNAERARRSEEYANIKKRLAQLDELIRLKVQIDKLFLKAQAVRGGIYPGLQADIEMEELYPVPETDQEYQDLLAKYTKDLSALQKFLAMKKAVYREDDDSLLGESTALVRLQQARQQLAQQGEQSLEEVDRRGFLKGLGAAAVAGVGGVGVGVRKISDNRVSEALGNIYGFLDAINGKDPESYKTIVNTRNWLDQYEKRLPRVFSKDWMGDDWYKHGLDDGKHKFQTEFPNGLQTPADREKFNTILQVYKEHFYRAALSSMEDFKESVKQGVAEAQTDYQKRRQRERDVDAGRPVKALPKNAKTDYQKKRAQDRKDMEMGEQQICPECGGPSFSDAMLAEKQDACYHKVKSRYKVWPSAYASGALVQCRKKGAANWGNKKK